MILNKVQYSKAFVRSLQNKPNKQAGNLVAFEYNTQPASPPKKHSLIFVGGLTDGLCSVGYLDDIVNTLEAAQADWSVFSILLSSSYSGYGMADLDSDVAQISDCVDYVCRYKQESSPVNATESPRVVLMGHSTGSQDVMHYITSPKGARCNVDGAILQAPVSDREAMHMIIKDNPTIAPAYDELVTLARKDVSENDGRDTILPHHLVQKIQFFGSKTPVSSYRFLSLASPDSPENPLPDDLFSSDLTDCRLQQTFGTIGSADILRGSLMVLESGNDEGVPQWVSKEKLLERWQNAIQPSHLWHPESGIVPGASHAPGLDQQGPKDDIARRVKVFLEDATRSS